MGAYFCSIDVTPRSTRGVRGPIDRFIMTLDDDENEDIRNRAGQPSSQNSKDM